MTFNFSTLLENSPIVFFDGECNLCNTSVNFILDFESDDQFYFCSLNSKIANQILKENFLLVEIPDSIVLLYQNKVYFKSDAVLQISKFLKPPFSFINLFGFIPTTVRDFFYDLIAKYRYKVFGRKDFCRVNSPSLNKKFLG
jgi:predicted DCC family thiol-disulfide oxidoreductase YuxK